MPSLLGSVIFFSAVVYGRGGDLFRFLDTAKVPRDKQPTLLRSSSLCSAVVNRKGSELIRFLNDTKILQDKWPLLLGWPRILYDYRAFCQRLVQRCGQRQRL